MIIIIKQCLTCVQGHRKKKIIIRPNMFTSRYEKTLLLTSS